MRKLFLVLLFGLGPCLGIAVPSAAQVGVPSTSSGLLPLNQGWRIHPGDDPRWADPSFDDRSWQPYDLGRDPAPQLRDLWYRLHLDLPASQPPTALELGIGGGCCEVYLNDQRYQGLTIRHWWRTTGTKRYAIPLPANARSVVIAIRVHIDAFDSSNSSSRIRASIGSLEAARSVVEIAQDKQLLLFLPSASINLAIVIGGIGMLLLYSGQRRSLEYLWLGLYLFLLGSSFGLFSAVGAGLVPGACNDLYSDPVIFLFTICQIEFTYAFIMRKPSRVWRGYELILLLTLILTVINLFGGMKSQYYYLIESIVVLPAALCLPVVLFYWYRRGNREAGWLILPSLFPAAGVIITNFNPIGQLFKRDFSFLLTPITLWKVVPLYNYDLTDAIFLLAIGIVMFARFSRVSQQTARASAEFEAARAIQQRLVPVLVPNLLNYRLRAAYLPAAEVGGDFYQVFSDPSGSALVVVGDVSGKGLKAAMTGALAIGALRALSEENPAPATLLTRLNRQICIAQNGGFITCLCAHFSHDGLVTLANAGHLAPYLNGNEVSLDNSLPLGVAEDEDYSQSTLRMAPGDLLTLLTDGVVEARSATGELFGFQRTASLSMQPAEEIAQTALAFGQEDDITVLSVMRLGSADPATVPMPELATT